jgi:hypothetical protein
MENHHAINGFIHYFDWAIFNSHVSSLAIFNSKRRKTSCFFETSDLEPPIQTLQTPRMALPKFLRWHLQQVTRAGAPKNP